MVIGETEMDRKTSKK